jgi:hypothetical protein
LAADLSVGGVMIAMNRLALTLPHCGCLLDARASCMHAISPTFPVADADFAIACAASLALWRRLVHFSSTVPLSVQVDLLDALFFSRPLEPSLLSDMMEKFPLEETLPPFDLPPVDRRPTLAFQVLLFAFALQRVVSACRNGCHK